MLQKQIKYLKHEISFILNSERKPVSADLV